MRLPHAHTPNSFRTAEMFKEQLRNLASQPTRVAVRSVVHATLAAVLALLSAGQVRDLRDELEHRTRQGRDVFAVFAGDGQLEASACERLRLREGVLASGSVLRDLPGGLADVDHFGIHRVEATAGMVEVVMGRPLPWEPGVHVGHAVAEVLGVGPGSRLVLAAAASGSDGRGKRSRDVASALPALARMPEWDRAVVDVVPARGPVQSCYAVVDPRALGPVDDRPEAVWNALTSAFPPTAAPAVVRIRPELVEGPQPEERFASRDRRYALGLGALSALALAGAWVVQRHGLALYALLGCRSNALYGALIADVLTVVGPATAFGFSLGVLAERTSVTGEVVSASMLADLAWFVVPVLALPAVGVVVVSRLDAVEVLRGD